MELCTTIPEKYEPTTCHCCDRMALTNWNEHTKDKNNTCYWHWSTNSKKSSSLNTNNEDSQVPLKSAFFLAKWYSRPCLESIHLFPRSGELQTQKFKSHLVRTQSWNVLPLTPGLGQYIAKHATPTARDFFPAYFYPSSPFICIFSPNLSRFFSCVGCG